jgi:hypothetical protein
MRIVRYMYITFLVFTFGYLGAFATDYNVTDDNALVDAFQAAQSGDIIRIAGGTYTPGDSLVIPEGVTIEGGWNSEFTGRNIEMNETIIDGEFAHSLLTSNGTTGWSIDGLILTGGTSTAAAVHGSVLRITNGGNGVISNTTITANDISSFPDDIAASRGTAVYISESSLTVENCIFRENFDTEKEYGEVVGKQSDAVVFVENTVNEGQFLVLSGTTFIDHADTLAGSMVQVGSGDLVITECLFEANNVGEYIIQSNGIVANATLTVMRNNYSGNDLLQFEDIEMEDCLVEDNTADGSIISSGGSVARIVDTNIQNNRSDSSLLDFSSSDLYKSLENVRVIGNLSDGRVIDMRNGEISLIDNCLLENNVADQRLFDLRATVNEIFDTIIRGNRSEPQGSSIIETRGDYFEMNNVTVENNFDPRRRGIDLRTKVGIIRESIWRGNEIAEWLIDIRSDVEVEFKMINTIIADNTINTQLVRLQGIGAMSILNSTFFNNKTSNGGIIQAGEVGSDYRLINNIFISNEAEEGLMPILEPLENHPFMDVSHNLVWDWVNKVSGWDLYDYFIPEENGNIEGDPMFVDAAEGNFRLTEASAAIDAGMALEDVTHDFDGTERPVGDAYDIGAFEGAITVSVDRGNGLLPDRYQLSQNYPNPFNPSTTIEFALEERVNVSIEIFNILGQRVRTLVAGDLFEAGYHQIQWSGVSDVGTVVPSGIYLYRMTAGEFTQVKRMMLLK